MHAGAMTVPCKNLVSVAQAVVLDSAEEGVVDLRVPRTANKVEELLR